MCLYRITKRYKTPTKRERVAFKLLEKDYRTPFYGFSVTFDQWLDAHLNEDVETYVGRATYTAGFHVFPTEENARNWMKQVSGYRHLLVVPVRVKGVTVEGIDGSTGLDMGIRTIVAQKMYVPKPRQSKKSV